MARPFSCTLSGRVARALSLPVPILIDSLVGELRAYLAQHPCRAHPDASLWPGKVKLKGTRS